MNRYPKMPTPATARIQTPIPRVPAVFRPNSVRAPHARANPGVQYTPNLANT